MRRQEPETQAVASSECGVGSDGSRARQMTLDLRWASGGAALDRPSGEAPSDQALVLNQLLRLLESTARCHTGVDPERADGPVSMFLYGAPGSGTSALMFALCDAAFDRGLPVACLPGRQLAQLSRPDPADSPADLEADGRHGARSGVAETTTDAGGAAHEVLAGLEALALVAIDDVDALTGDPEWAAALFGLINRCHAAGTPLLFVSSTPPDHLQCPLPDLHSRLVWGGVYAWESRGDASISLLLAARARDLGVDPPVEVVDFLLTHGPRAVRPQLELFEEVATLSLSKQRRLSRRFVQRWWREREECEE